MTTYDNNKPSVSLDVRDFLGNYLKKEDLSGPAEVTLVEVRPEQVPGENRTKLVAQFREFEKPLILNKTNIKRLAAFFGSHNAATWRGRIGLYVDENVEYAGSTVGGIRVRQLDEAVQRSTPTPTLNGVSPDHRV